ncbi:HORMA domain-containing protein 2 isoform X5 [Lagopus muta]|uniref:HORMA domain-containing protein 2 isoform X5 n=1 Tax=Lagopus muta TaxID=64668 RepID=UPI0020A126A9|nr:HORMA domain-containing protein 2 isoform X5 [Lagopus muta]
MMATCQLLSRPKNKTSKEFLLFPSKITTKQQSVVLVKRLLAVSVSCITYLRGLFPESSYGTRYLDDLCLKILREDKSCLGSFQIVKWIQGCFDALEKQYLHVAVLAMYTNPEEPETVTELYQFKFKYKQEVPEMDIISNRTNFVNGVRSEDMKQACSLLIRKLYLLMQNLGPLPSDISLTMKLLYYNDGSVSTGFHTLKVKVTTENKRMGRVESNLIQKNSPTEICHQGLDCDEEEEEGSTKNNPLPVRAESDEHGKDGKDRNYTQPGLGTEASSFCLQDTGGKGKMEIKEMGRRPSSQASQQISCLNLAFSQEEVIGPKKKRKVSEPEKLLLEGRK